MTHGLKGKQIQRIPEDLYLFLHYVLLFLTLERQKCTAICILKIKKSVVPYNFECWVRLDYAPHPHGLMGRMTESGHCALWGYRVWAIEHFLTFSVRHLVVVNVLIFLQFNLKRGICT